jgi:hypothetical protein
MLNSAASIIKKLNHHDKVEFKEDVEKTGKPDVIKEDKIDFGKDVKQAITELPNPAKDATVQIPQKALEGKKSTKGVAEIKKYEDEIGCGFCGVPVSRGGIGAVVNVKGKKFKKVEGKYRLHSPGAEDGSVTGVLCEAHAKEADQLPDGVIDIKRAIAIGPDGVQNIDVKSL